LRERLQKVLARSGLGSRRSCEDLLRAGRVRVNGEVAHLGDSADPLTEEIRLDGRRLPSPEVDLVIALHKPRGVVSSLRPQGDRQTVRELVSLPGRLYPVGRLDVESEGLVFLTNQGQLAHRLTHPRFGTEKEYRVQLDRTPGEAILDAWRRGRLPDGTRFAPAEVRFQSRPEAWVQVVLREGKKRQIRETARALGLQVRRLIRVRIGPVPLGQLRPGEWRVLSRKEILALERGTGPVAGRRMARRRSRAQEGTWQR
jgi:pseudouridine synthase